MAERFNKDPDLLDEQPVVCCPACGCPAGPIGILGRLAHYTCPDCGAWFNRLIEEDI